MRSPWSTFHESEIRRHLATPPSGTDCVSLELHRRPDPTVGPSAPRECVQSSASGPVAITVECPSAVEPELSPQRARLGKGRQIGGFIPLALEGEDPRLESERILV